MTSISRGAGAVVSDRLSPCEASGVLPGLAEEVVVLPAVGFAPAVGVLWGEVGVGVSGFGVGVLAGTVGVGVSDFGVGVIPIVGVAITGVGVGTRPEPELGDAGTGVAAERGGEGREVAVATTVVTF